MRRKLLTVYLLFQTYFRNIYISLYQEKAPSEDNIIPAQDLQQLNSANAPRQQHICPQHQGSGNELLPTEDTGSLLPTIPPLCQLK